MNTRKVAYSTIVQFATKFIGLFVSSFFLVVLAGTLGTGGMGYYITAVAYVMFFSTLADIGMNVVLTRELAQNPERQTEIASQFLGFRLTFGAIIMILAPLSALLIPQYAHNPLLVYGIAIVALSQMLLLVNQIFVGSLQVKFELDRAMLTETLNRIVVFGLAVWGSYHVFGSNNFYYFALWITVAGATVNTIGTYLFTRRHWKIVPKMNWQIWKELFVALLPMGIFTFLGMVHFKADTVILSLMKPAFDVGIYGYAYKIVEIMIVLPALFLGTVLPKLSELHKDGLSPVFIDFAQKSFNSLTLFTLPLVVFVFAIAPYLTTLLSRQNPADGVVSGRLLQILCIGLLAWFFENYFQYLLLIGRHYRGLIRNIAIVAVINVILNIVFIPYYSYYATATMTAITGTLLLILSANYCGKAMKYLPRLDVLVPVLSATIVMLVCLVVAEHFVGLTPLQFGSVSRLYQLGILMLFGAVGLVTYLVVLLPWKKSLIRDTKF